MAYAVSEKTNPEELWITFDPDARKAYSAVKRVMDVICSAAALVILSPVFLVTIIAIRLDGGPAFYTQTRVGKNGVPFKMYKFRSMCVDADKMLDSLLQYNDLATGPAFKMIHDPRVTKVGHFIRKYSIDELPQLLNIIKGDMSIVGPRPPLPREVEQYTDYQKQRLMVTPGLTCYWQTYGRSDIPFDRWVQMDLEYIQKRSLWVDIKLIARTIYTVIFKRGAY